MAIEFDLTNSEASKLVELYLSRNLDFQRYELLGDRVIGLYLTEDLLKDYPKMSEGDISKRLGYLWSKKTFLDLMNSILRTHISSKDLADFFEVILGYLYLQNRIDHIRSYLREKFRVYKLMFNDDQFNPKGQLQEFLADFKSLPRYSLVRSIRVKGKMIFLVVLEFKLRNSFKSFWGAGNKIKSAETDAALKAIYFLRSLNLLIHRSYIYLLVPQWQKNISHLCPEIQGFQKLYLEMLDGPFLMEISPFKRKFKRHSLRQISLF